MVNHEGWTCPTCKRTYAPWVPSCNCINSAVGVNTTSITITPHADDTAELVEALERVARGALWDDLVDRWLVQPEAMEWVRAVLARVKGGELGEGWDEPYAHRDPGNARPARTALREARADDA